MANNLGQAQDQLKNILYWQAFVFYIGSPIQDPVANVYYKELFWLTKKIHHYQESNLGLFYGLTKPI
jgi:hypothetical protein